MNNNLIIEDDDDGGQKTSDDFLEKNYENVRDNDGINIATDHNENEIIQVIT